MNINFNSFKPAIIFLTGIAAGAFGGFFVAKNMYGKKYNEELKKLRKRVDKDDEIADKILKAVEIGTNTSYGLSAVKFDTKSPATITEEREQMKSEEVEEEDDDQFEDPPFDDDDDDEPYRRSIFRPGEEMHFECSQDKPYIISDDEYMELSGYDAITLLYFEGDDVLADDTAYERVDDIVGTIGPDALKCLDEDHDCVYVRNDTRKADYEILADVRCWSDVRGEYLKQHHGRGATALWQ